jgi:sRNA-binding regulator protein Hfq
MSSDSTIYTIGTALNRARDNAVPVHILVEGQWLSGHVVAVDGFGVVLADEHGDEREHAVVRMESVSAVRILSPAPGRTPITAGATPMPEAYPAY